jgi:pilus assembly protein Flp/PilA
MGHAEAQIMLWLYEWTGRAASPFPARFRNDRSGATSIEYALLASFIGMVLLATLRLIQNDLIGIFEKVNNGFN